jgi:hypothetical protein
MAKWLSGISTTFGSSWVLSGCQGGVNDGEDVAGNESHREYEFSGRRREGLKP